MRAVSHFFFTAADLAHKTGALGGIRFDASILCLSSNRTDVPAFERRCRTWCAIWPRSRPEGRSARSWISAVPGAFRLRAGLCERVLRLFPARDPAAGAALIAHRKNERPRIPD